MTNYNSLASVDLKEIKLEDSVIFHPSGNQSTLKAEEQGNWNLNTSGDILTKDSSDNVAGLNTVECQSLKIGDALIEVDSGGVVIKLKNSTTGIYEVLIRFYK